MLEQQKISEKMFYRIFFKKMAIPVAYSIIAIFIYFFFFTLSYYYLYNQLSVKAFLLLLPIEILLNLNGFYFE
ncbi:hypothetical protein LA081_02890 [Mycoplasmopsis synoviae]|nr:hypothetical protein LA081_02890 [Mycoplasmopsis synoviae]